MDLITRGRERNWRADGSPESQAAAIRDGIRYGKLDPKKVQLCAFLGHQAASLVDENVKPGGVIMNQRLVKNGDMRELALGVSYFGRPAVMEINLALVQMAFATRLSTSRNSNYHYYERLSCGWRGQFANRTLWLRIRKYGMEAYTGVDVNEWWEAVTQNKLKILKDWTTNQNYINGPSYTYPSTLADCVLNLAHEAAITSRGRPKVIKFCNGYYDDSLMFKYMKQRIFPWALGEFYEGDACPPFIAYAPYVNISTR